jgi:plastocyanin
MRNGRTGIYAAAAAICLLAGLGVAGAAGAPKRADQVIEAHDDFVWHPATVTIQTHETVTWRFVSGFHNVRSTSANWTFTTGDGQPATGDHPYTFDTPGTYTFECEFHAAQGMTGTVTVQDEPVTPTPTPTTTATPTTSATPTPTPTTQPGGGMPTTPPPSAGTDTVKPRVRSVKLKALRRAVRVQFKLSEPATVTVAVKRRKAVLKSKRIQAGAGVHKVTLRSKRLKKGRYTIEIRARDAYGNRSKLATKRLVLRR